MRLPLLPFLLFLLLLPSLPLRAQTDSLRTFATGEALSLSLASRVRERCTSFGVGGADVFDTYLSPQAYSGIELRFMRQSGDAVYQSSRRWLRQTHFEAFVSRTGHPSEDNTDLSFLAEWRWGMLHRLPLGLPSSVQVLLGGQVYGEGGVIYNLANGNNPAAMKLGAGAGLAAQASWRFRIKPMAREFMLRYQYFMPLAGLFFSPHYGQSYYEIFSLGHSSGVVHFSWPGNKPAFWNHLSLDVPLGRRAVLRLSYVADIRQSSVENLKYHNWSHAFMAGLVHKFVRL